MSDDSQEQRETEERLAEALAEEEAAAPEQPASKQDITALRRELAELNDRYLRLAADYQNFARRSEQKAGDAREQQVMDMARALVTVLDHFDRALAVDSQTASAENVLAGTRIVRDEMLRVLERFGVQRVEAQPGAEFDPRRHEALLRQRAEGIDTDHVVMQMQPGYMLGEKTLRPAQVSVAE